MTAEPEKLTARLETSMTAIPRSAWNALAHPSGHPSNPFMDWDFLEAMESAGCASPRTGWVPQHFLVTRSTGELTGALPAYLKSHSRGEFVFDHAWADALERAGGHYYPKLLCASPFTPVTGPRLLVGTGPDADRVRETLLGAAVTLAKEAGASSAHFNFLTEPDWRWLGDKGLLLRTDQQFHWINRNYRSFDDFLSALTSRKRKMIRRERSIAQEGLQIERATGAALTPRHWDAFFGFYLDTGSRKWGSPYLNRAFFEKIHERMADQVLLVIAYLDGRPIAAALNFIGSDTLYGRYWGRSLNRPFLHFELCYYQALDFAIERGLSRVEAGAQGEHKLARGYEPHLTRSAHWIAYPPLREAVARYLDRERAAVEQGVEYLSELTPFRRDVTVAPGSSHDTEEEEGF
ncbi:MAG: GNAT family N-acetyltransferase [Alphaproteobacteria bacterium]|nr:GNAT family N-acetyltransferase [Alphaproteobacteria bacterium]